MSRFCTAICISLFLLFNTCIIAEEGDIEPLMVPQVHDNNTPTELENDIVTDDAIIEEQGEAVQTEVTDVSTEQTNTDESTTQEEATTQTDESTQQVQEEASQEESKEATEEIQEQPSEEELEAKHAEETELREVGAGEESID